MGAQFYFSASFSSNKSEDEIKSFVKEIFDSKDLAFGDNSYICTLPTGNCGCNVKIYHDLYMSYEKGDMQEKAFKEFMIKCLDPDQVEYIYSKIDDESEDIIVSPNPKKVLQEEVKRVDREINSLRNRLVYFKTELAKLGD